MASNRRVFSDNSSSSDDSSDDEPQIQQTKKTVGKGATKAAAKPYLAVSDEEDDVKRVVRSGKTKVNEEIEEIVKKTKHAMRIRDIGVVFECYENLIKAYEKARRVLDKEQNMPRPYVKILSQLDEFVDTVTIDKEKPWKRKNDSSVFSVGAIKHGAKH